MSATTVQQVPQPAPMFPVVGDQQAPLVLLALLALVAWRMLPDGLKWLMNRGAAAEQARADTEAKVRAAEFARLETRLDKVEQTQEKQGTSIAELKAEVRTTADAVTRLSTSTVELKASLTEQNKAQTAALLQKLEEVEHQLRADTQRSIADVLHVTEAKPRRR